MEGRVEIPNNQGSGGIGIGFIISLDADYGAGGPFLIAGGKPLIRIPQMMAIVAPPGAGKSFVCAAITAGALASGFGIDGIDSLGFEFVPKAAGAPIKVAHLDTERDAVDNQKTLRMIHGILDPGGTRQDIIELENGIRTIRNLTMISGSYCETLSELWRVLEANLELHRPDLLVADGIKDFFCDINDSSQTQSAIRRLRTLGLKYNTAIVFTVHDKRTSDETALSGHLGTNIGQQCRAVLAIKKSKLDPNIRVITDKFKDGKTSYSGGGIALAYRYDEALGRMASCEVPEAGPGHPLTGQHKARLTKEICERVWAEYMKDYGNWVPSSLAKKALMDELGVSTSTVKSLLMQAITDGWLESEGASSNTRYRLTGLPEEELPI